MILESLSDVTNLPGERKKLLYSSCKQTGWADILDDQCSKSAWPV